MDWLELIRESTDSVIRSVMGAKPRFQVITAKIASSLEPKPAKPSLRKGVFDAKAIVKDRPVYFEDRYIVTSDKDVVERVFNSLKQRLFLEADQVSTKARYSSEGKIILREQGTTSDGSPFIFFKPFSDYGWLIERNDSGWRIGRAEKILRPQMFMRSSTDPWDTVHVYTDPQGVGSIRIKSRRFGHALMSIPVYEDRMGQAFIDELLGTSS
jgi:hypothetical protein